jgi:UDP-2,3-diacylglucosamine pyrophosphatase LpxH
MTEKRILDIVVLSDVHLGTYGCHAKELLQYLKTIKPQKLILNGDIFDIWNYSKSYFPDTHLKVIQYILKMASKGTEVIYLTGNHDDKLRNFTPLYLGNIQVLDSYHFLIGDKLAWVFHGDVFDNTTKGMAKALAIAGGKGYDLLILLNRLVNWCLERLGRPKASFSKQIKNSVKKAVKFINHFEEKICEVAIQEGNSYVICGHIHKQEIKKVTINDSSVVYINSGDWVENLTAIEFVGEEFWIYQHSSDKVRYEELLHEIESELDGPYAELEQKIRKSL